MLTPRLSVPLFPDFVAHSSVEIDYAGFGEFALRRWGVPLPPSLGRAVVKRKAEYVAGRVCVREAGHCLLGHFTDVSAVPPEGASGSPPVWPEGLVGSITHTRGWASAALARCRDVQSIGLDTERIVTDTVLASIRDSIGFADETDATASRLPPKVAVTLVFSAKESVFKCLYPLVRRIFWFSDVRVEIFGGECEGMFRATLIVDLGCGFDNGTVLEGRYIIAGPFVHTGVMCMR